MMVVCMSDGVLTLYTYCGHCNQWCSDDEHPHVSGKHDLFLQNEPCLLPDHQAFIVVSMVEEKMFMMNVANANVRGQNEGNINDVAPLDEEEEDSVNKNDGYADNSNEGHNKIVANAVNNPWQIREVVTHCFILQNISNWTAASPCSGSKTLSS
jgi:hypothetical protein